MGPLAGVAAAPIHATMAGMIGAPLRRLVAASLLVLLSAYGVEASSSYSQTIYRSTAFATQTTSYFCTSAVVQNIRNLATGESRRWSMEQASMYALGRSLNLYDYARPGVDPQGVERLLERYVPGSEWRQVRATTMQGALQAAARGMHATGLPAVLFVSGGQHVWTMNGYTSTKAPTATNSFRVTHVRFSGPYYPKQKGSRGWFDLAPNTPRSVDRLAEAFFPYRQILAFGGHRWTPWNGYYVAVVPVSVGGPDPTPTPTPNPTPTPTFTPPPSGTPLPTATPAPPSAPPTDAPEPSADSAEPAITDPPVEGP